MKTTRTAALRFFCSPLLFAAVLLCSFSVHAQAPWTVQSLYEAFKPVTGFTVNDIQWKFLTECNATNCFGTNPDSPYGMPNFAPQSENGILFSKMNASDAFVVIMETPPKHRYFSLTPYIFSRLYSPPTGWVPVFESLSDSVNTNTIVTVPGNVGVQPPFSQIAVFIQAADDTTITNIQNRFIQIGVPAQAINTFIMPATRLQLRMNSGMTADTFTMLMRMAYPENKTARDEYIHRDPSPVRFMHLVATNPPPFVARTPQQRRAPREMPKEINAYLEARNAVMTKVVDLYSDRYDFDADAPVDMLGTTGTFPCTTLHAPCNGDAPDALYSKDFELPNGIADSRKRDRLLVVGVNHVLTGRATYLSHSVNRVEFNKGIVGVSDGEWLNQTGRLLMGPGASVIYDKVYAFMLAYDCESDEEFCVQIPQDDEDGIPPGEEMKIAGRFYLDNVTNTRPGEGLFVAHRVRFMRRKD